MENDFFNFSSKLISSTVQVHAVGLKTEENGIDSESNLIKGKYEGINFPVIFNQEYGKKLTDILDTGWPGFFLISDRIRLILEENHLTGWKMFPVKIYNKKREEILNYAGFSVVGSCDSIDYKKSEIIEKRMVPSGPLCRLYKGIVIDGWDGSDFFTPEGIYQTFITKKAADILKKTKISNLRLENLTEYETDITNILR